MVEHAAGPAPAMAMLAALVPALAARFLPRMAPAVLVVVMMVHVVSVCV
jgi:hypothetical protein